MCTFMRTMTPSTTACNASCLHGLLSNAFRELAISLLLITLFFAARGTHGT